MDDTTSTETLPGATPPARPGYDASDATFSQAGWEDWADLFPVDASTADTEADTAEAAQEGERHD